MAPQRIQKNNITRTIHIVKDYVEHLQRGGLTVDKVYLYGSRAKNTARKSSDIDVAIISPEFKDNFTHCNIYGHTEDGKTFGEVWSRQDSIAKHLTPLQIRLPQ